VQAFNENFLRQRRDQDRELVSRRLRLSDGTVSRRSRRHDRQFAVERKLSASREVLWGYAHYGQFSKVGWQYLNGACGQLAGGGTFVTLKSPGKDYSVIVETKGAKPSRTSPSTSAAACPPANSASGAATPPRNSSAGRHHAVTAPSPSRWSPRPSIPFPPPPASKRARSPTFPPTKEFPFPYYETFDEYAEPRAMGLSAALHGGHRRRF
jgi:hypothetical protein